MRCRFRVACLLGLIPIVAGACSKENDVDASTHIEGAIGLQCHDNKDCGTAGVCALGYCRAGCLTDAECPQGALCVGEQAPYGCSLPAELACSAAQPCVSPLVCGIDGKCRHACVVDANCPRNEHICIAETCLGGEPVRDQARACLDPSAGMPSFLVGCAVNVFGCNVFQFGRVERPCKGTCLWLTTKLRPSDPYMTGACFPGEVGNPKVTCSGCIDEATACASDLDCAQCAASGSGCTGNVLFSALELCAASCPKTCGRQECPAGE